MIKKKTSSKFSFDELVALEEKFGVTLGGPGGFRSEIEKAPRVRMGYGVGDKATKARKATKLSTAKAAPTKATAKR